MKRQRALSGASSLQCRSVQEILVVFCENDLSALMLTLGVADFSALAPLGVFASLQVANPLKGRLPPPYRFTVLLAHSFHFSFTI
jgi:hypothetical protein